MAGGLKVIGAVKTAEAVEQPDLHHCRGLKPPAMVLREMLNGFNRFHQW